MDLDEGLQAFVAEAGDLLSEMEGSLLKLGQENGETAPLIHAVFRTAHTIKGTAGLFGLRRIVEFTHAVESVLDGVRDGSLGLDDVLVGVLLSCKDHIGAMVQDVALGGVGTVGGQGELLLAELHRRLGRTELAASCAGGTRRVAEADCVVDAASIAGIALAAVDDPAAAGLEGCWHVAVHFGADAFRQGLDPAAFVSYLRKLGEIAAIRVIDDGIPRAAQMDPESCYLGFEIELRSTASQQEIERVFEFAEGHCSLRLLPPGAPRLAPAEPPIGIGAGSAAVGASLTTRGDRSATVATVAAVPAEAEREPRESRTVRVDADRLGHLITLVGELIIASARTSLAATRLRDPELRDSTELLASLVEEVRDSTLQLRMVRIGATFRRFQRLVHDAAHERGKDIQLQISGEQVELDKTLVERIADPLTHLVRNAIDHGIESTPERIARGKPPAGTIALSAHHDASTIIIEVSDDGAGLSRERILAKAVSLGLASADDRLTDKEVQALIFEPGVSTASAITSLSGRGVGMDVVRQNIEAMRGSIAIDSREGEGTTVRVRLPLTLAIVDCLLVRIGASSFAMPLSMVEECVANSDEEAAGLHQLRGEVLPVIVLRDLFRLNGPPPRRASIVVVRHAGQKAGLVVDALLGQVQAVMKPLSPLLAGVRCISGSTILGSGEVALVLDLPALLKQNKEAWTC